MTLQLLLAKPYLIWKFIYWELGKGLIIRHQEQRSGQQVRQGQQPLHWQILVMKYVKHVLDNILTIRCHLAPPSRYWPRIDTCSSRILKSRSVPHAVFTDTCGCGCHAVRSGSFFTMPPFTKALCGAVKAWGQLCGGRLPRGVLEPTFWLALAQGSLAGNPAVTPSSTLDRLVYHQGM